MIELSSKSLIKIIVCGTLLAGSLPLALGYDVPTVPTPTGSKPALTITPAAPQIKPTSEATKMPYENPYTDIPFSRTKDGAPVLGDPDAPITIIEFADFACPYCQRYEPTMQEFIQKYVATGHAKYEFRILPTAGGQMTSFIGSMANCMEDQDAGVFWPLHDALYARAELGEYNDDMMKEVAKQFHLNYLDALTCLGEHGKPLQAEIDTQLAHLLSVGGTPAIRVRYRGHNNEEAQYLVVDGQLHVDGGPPLNVLEQAVKDAETGHIPDAEITRDVPMLPSIPV